MKGDFSRCRDGAGRRYSDVRLQQGRVLLDSDWNEQMEIASHLRETEAIDGFGVSAGPMYDAGFGIIIDPGGLSAEERELYGEALSMGDFLISPGRYYVDGILCENPSLLLYSDQEYLKPRPGEGIARLLPGIYQVYLDVWKRHISYIEDPDIREVALGGPDSTTRTKVEWRVVARSENEPIEGSVEVPFNCKALQGAWPASSGGEMTVLLRDSSGEDEACRIAERGMYQGVENHLYRVEIHHGGNPFGWRGADPISAKKLPFEDQKGERISLGTNPAGAADSWQKGRLIEAFIDEEPGATARIVSWAFENDDLILTLDRVLPAWLGDDFYVQPLASFKWSRENGSVAFGVEEILDDLVDRSIITRARVSRLGQELGLTLRRGDFIEVSGDREEARGEVGTLAQVKDVQEGDLMVELDQDISCHKGDSHLKIRRWDQAEECLAVSLEKAAIEHGLAVKFGGSGFLAGDYWTFYARVGGAVEALDEARPPAGVSHHYCNLGVIRIARPPSDTEEQLMPGLFQDCRNLFPPASELVALHYVGGDGQEAMPGEFLAEPLRVRVLNGGVPVLGAGVRFTIESGDGSLEAGLLPSGSERLAAGPERISITRDDGIAECRWSLVEEVPDQENPPQPLVRAVLLDQGGDPVLGQEILFGASLSLASQVYYGSGDCLGSTVRAAIDRLGDQVRLHPASGLEHVTNPGDVIELKVLAAGVCGPVAGATIQFSAEGGGGVLPATATTDSGGIASSAWTVHPENRVQRVTATLIDASPEMEIALPHSVIFTAHLNIASGIIYDEPRCVELADARTVHDAIDVLCRRKSGRGCAATVGEGGVHVTLGEALSDVSESDVCLCLLPGEHTIEGMEIDLERSEHLDAKIKYGKAHLSYSTFVQEKPFAYAGWGWYNLIGFLGDAYLSGFCARRPILGGGEIDPVLWKESGEKEPWKRTGQLFKVLRDRSEEVTFTSSEPLDLDEGYRLSITGIDVDGSKVTLKLSKNGADILEEIVDVSRQETSNFCYKGVVGTSIIAVHFKNAFHGAEAEIATIDGLFQASDTPIGIIVGDVHGLMKVTGITHHGFSMAGGPVAIEKGGEVALMEPISLVVADQEKVDEKNPLRFMIKRRVAGPGRFEIRGAVRRWTGSVSWDPQSFSGFYYDLDNDSGVERLGLDAGAIEGGVAVKYLTSPKERRFAMPLWGWYRSIGFLGEDHLAAYSERTVVVGEEEIKPPLFEACEDSDPLKEEQLQRVLINSEDRVLLRQGQTLSLKGGYILDIVEVDSLKETIAITLQMAGVVLDRATIKASSKAEIAEKTYIYRRTVGELKGLVTIAVYFSGIIKHIAGDRAAIEGIFQLSEEVTAVSKDTVYGRMRISEVSSKAVEMSGGISIGRGEEIILLGDIRRGIGIGIRAADQDWISTEEPLKLQLYRTELQITELQAGESLDLRSAKALAEEGALISWDPQSFSGFFYDTSQRFVPFVSLRIAGCGRASRVILKGGPLLFRGFSSISLKDLDLSSEDLQELLRIDGCREVVMRSCDIGSSIGFDGKGRSRPLLSILKADRIRISSSMLGSDGLLSMVLIGDGSSDAVIEESRINGGLSLYGQFKESQVFREVAEAIRYDNIAFGGRMGDLHLRGNKMKALVIGDGVDGSLVRPIGEGRWEISNIFSNIFIEGNTVEYALIFAEHIFLNSNRFIGHIIDPSGAVGRYTTYIGNQSDEWPELVQLVDSSVYSEKAANLMRIVPFEQ
ncbi:MAG: hypothetical protein JW986_05725 [Methanotrichaceae archaeon]|nr:hypothetical protein [Methanotrichaceae archaeon]